ncbi:nucleolar Jumonji domain interacting protein, putative [Plasmodium berghei]|uniref:WD repeat-containing protein 55, putative n=2 Tax=Plasmodium berghei TaxID=5821 RepID=A0A509AR30_PLABA|nr:WD repeat-containing protein 55, putative [Plasmodium berghei ANKA]CXI83177.1 nucleolar Jumonji domain interacting protein, putative [Plasmodium berghei]SCM25689.1 nucleolar Jumonji domain interacting protein, putative [Plasmodium berghei]SCN27453.1 nucleolar Jumonji domain interacting protein, putative [Plasmodium berghei]SCO62156.1 nucleolar Jumonji domain interacting protein, putative [Plasmodium berghei]SCO63880.1 nucleolar Jumonji domain interacting protein, putative [Plasmodium berghe|eukprot:XP_034423085.1 WD repeat-containing protein 55, putative [Plasmodium berghei ANKA]
MNDIYTSIKCKSIVFDVDFHPKLDLICTGLLDGNLLLYKLKEEKKKFQKKWNIDNYEKSVRFLSFSNNGKNILAAFSDSKCSVFNITGDILWTNKCHKYPISSILYTGLNTFLTADESGIIKHWDIRDKSNKPIHQIKEFDDTISSMVLDKEENSIVVASGGYLELFDILNKKRIYSNAISQEYKDEFLCCNFISQNSKIVSTTMGGNIIVFSRTPWGCVESKIKANKNMINTFVKINDNTIIFGTSDGLIQTAHFNPNKLGDVIARNNTGDSIEKLTINNKKTLLASISHDYSIDFYQIKVKDSHISNPTKKKKKSFFRDL